MDFVPTAASLRPAAPAAAFNAEMEREAEAASTPPPAGADSPAFVQPKTPLAKHGVGGPRARAPETPPTPPDVGLMSLSVKKASAEAPRAPGTPDSPALPKTQRSTIKKVSAKTCFLLHQFTSLIPTPRSQPARSSPLSRQLEAANASSAFDSPVASSPADPKLVRSTVKKGAAPSPVPHSESPLAASPPMPVLASAKKAARTPDAGFASPQVETPEAPPMARSTVKKSRGGVETATPPVMAAAAAADATPDTPPELQTSFSMSATKELARELAGVDTPSSLGSPDALTPPVPPMSSVKKAKRTPLR
jgi:hypothetical protein